jgi:uncharacterized protein
MAKPPPYSVPLREISDDPVHRSFTVSPQLVGEWLKGLPMRDALGAPEPDPDAGSGRAELDLYAEGNHIFATGTFKGDLTVACSRCVEPVKLVIDERLMVTFMPKSEMPADEVEAEEGAEVPAEDLDLFPYEDDFVDLEPLFREQFVLAVPYAPLCKEDCKGLCPQCGTDLNTGTCACQAPVDPRFAGLKNLKLPSA